MPRQRANEKAADPQTVYLAFDDNAGICTIPTQGGNEVPIVAVNKDGLGVLRRYLKERAARYGQSGHIRSFSASAVYETFPAPASTTGGTK